MALKYHPTPGTVLYCDFGQGKCSYGRCPGTLGGFKPPEMVKRRPVVVLTNKHAQLATVVPLSGTPPDPVMPYHYPIPKGVLPPSIDHKAEWWAKCDCVTTVGFFRLNLVQQNRRGPDGKRLYDTRRIGNGPLGEIRRRVAEHLCLST